MVTNIIFLLKTWSMNFNKEAYDLKTASEVITQMAEAIGVVHNQDYMHRDLKPENFMLDQNKKIVKLIDFGFSKKLKSLAEFSQEEQLKILEEVAFKGEMKCLKTPCGTPNYAAPELISGKAYTKNADLWSLGCVIYALVYKQVPFGNSNHALLFRDIIKGDFTIPEDTATVPSVKTSPGLRELLTGLINKDPDKRADTYKEFFVDKVKSI